MASTADKITDVRNAARPNSARVTSPRSAGGTTLNCDNLSGWPTASKVHFVTYTVDSSSVPVVGTQLDCYGIVSGNDINSFHVVDGNDTGNSVGDYVEMLPTAAWGQDLADALTAQHSRTGAHVGISNTGGLTTDTATVTGNETVGGTLGVTGATTLTGPVGGAGYSVATISNPYKFSAYRNAGLAQASNAIVIYDTKLFDIGSNYSVSTGLFTAPVAGFYKFDASLQIASNASFVFNVGLQKNASGTLLIGNYFNGTSNSQGLVINAPPIQLAAGDTIGVIFGSNNGGNTTANVGASNTWFGGFLISAT